MEGSLAVAGDDDGPAVIPGLQVMIKGGQHVGVGSIERPLAHRAAFLIKDRNIRLPVARSKNAASGIKDGGVVEHRRFINRFVQLFVG